MSEGESDRLNEYFKKEATALGVESKLLFWFSDDNIICMSEIIENMMVILKAKIAEERKNK